MTVKLGALGSDHYYLPVSSVNYVDVAGIGDELWRFAHVGYRADFPECRARKNLKPFVKLQRAKACQHWASTFTSSEEELFCKDCSPESSHLAVKAVLTPHADPARLTQWIQAAIARTHDPLETILVSQPLEVRVQKLVKLMLAHGKKVDQDVMNFSHIFS